MRSLFFVLLFVLVQSFNAFSQVQTHPDASAIKLKLEKLAHTGSVLYLAAHPDDENTGLIAYMANEELARTAYLSLTRGDGGQNLIGSEQGKLLGLIRTNELLQARKIDKGEQYFTRANDFGFSKSYEESLNFWGRDSVLKDVVWIIRKFRPDVIITRFPANYYKTHGHHTASAILAKEAFHTAADSSRFPEQLDYVDVWQPKRLLFNASRWFRPDLEEYYKANGKKYITFDLGTYNPLMGKTYAEIAAESRSMHKSQGFGTAPRRGEQVEFLEYIEGSIPESHVFDGIDVSWNRVKGGKKIQQSLDKINKEYDEDAPNKSIPALVALYRQIRELPVDPLVEYKKEQLRKIIADCAALHFQAYANRYYTAPGDTVWVNCAFVDQSDYPVTVSKISVPLTGIDTMVSKVVNSNQMLSSRLPLIIPANMEYTQPYWLRQPMDKGLYHVESYKLRGLPVAPPELTAAFDCLIEDEKFTFEIPIEYEWVDPVKGELFRPVEVAPSVTLNFLQPSYIFSSTKPRQVEILVKALKNEQRGNLQLKLPKGWKCEPASIDLELEKENEEQQVTFTITPAEGEVRDTIRAFFYTQDKTFDRSLISIDYPHLPVLTVMPPASAPLVKMQVNRLKEKIGYLPGAGDKVAEMLSNIGYPVTILDPERVQKGNLQQFDVIITGVRAYNTVKQLTYLNEVLLNYVHDGGTLLVQYNTNRGLEIDKIGPYPFTISRERVTVEDSPVKFVLPDHPLLNYPNKITQEDFNGWVQERGLYFAQPWSEEYQTPLAFKDPGEEFLKGSLLVASYGKGKFIYTGISFFRELPAGVPGAYKLFINLISYGQAER